MKTCLAIALTCLLGVASAQGAEQPLVVERAAYRLEIDRGNGSIVRLCRPGQVGSIFVSGERGLWHARFQDGKEVAAADFSTGDPARQFSIEPSGPKVRLHYRSPEITVVVHVEAAGDAVRLIAEVAPTGGTLLELALPARLRFDPHQIRQVVCPSNGNYGVGVALAPRFFERQSEDEPAGWTRFTPPKNGYHRLFPKGLIFGPLDPPPVPLTVTDAGRRLLPGWAVKTVDGRRAVVNRAMRREDADEVLVESPDGPYFAGARLGGKGGLWRIGGKVSTEEESISIALVVGTIARLADRVRDRTKIALLNMRGGPSTGSFTSVGINQWRERLDPILPARGLSLVEPASVAEMIAALRDPQTLAIVNPYGEWVPTTSTIPLAAVMDALAASVRDGGHWFETGGHSFHAELRPVEYFSEQIHYPPAFADFLHVAATAGEAAVYRVAPRTWAPWSAKADGPQPPPELFVPGTLAWGADPQGGYCERAYAHCIKPGQRWQAPPVEIAVGQSAVDAARRYAVLGGVTRPLAEKAPPELLTRLKQAVLVYYQGSAKEKEEHLKLVPAGSLLHFADYLKGGFDKEYPDHLPPNAAFGTLDELKRFCAQARREGHLFMPYTNPTWWCDNPPGPTFAKRGKAGLLKTLDGKVVRERYSRNEGYTITFWHPDVQEANRRTRRQFTEDVPVDVLFQDQCGARTWRYDTNESSPSPAAYIEGLLSMVEEDARVVPLSTEAGWDGVVNSQTQLCGLSFGLLPNRHAPPWRRLLREQVSPRLWTVFPLAQAIAHDKAMMLHHDLGQFVVDRRSQAWTLGLGFSLSYRVRAGDLAGDERRHWLLWLDRLQKSVVARYVGAPLVRFEHLRPEKAASAADAREDDGTIRAAYGPVELWCNLGPGSTSIDGRTIDGFGFFAAAPAVTAGTAGAAAAYVFQQHDDGGELWTYAPGGATVEVALPAGTAVTKVRFDGRGDESAVRSKDGIRVVCPPASDATPRLWHARVRGE